MRMKKRLCLVLLAAFTMTFAGCLKEKTEGGHGADDAVKGKSELVSEDYVPGNEAILKTEKGYYYYSPVYKGFRYYDIALKNEMYLCNKPECKHDGNAFCVATNENYFIDRIGLYGGKIYATAIEETETQYLFQLLTVALDGSELNEVATYLTLEKVGQVPATISNERDMCLHRNMAMIPMWTVGEDGLEDSMYYGTAVVNLETREVTYLDEEPLSKENIEVTDISAHGDYFYYFKKEGKKTVLHRYNMKDGSDETYKLLVGFGGDYAVLKDGTIVYVKKQGRELCVHHCETGQNEEKTRLMKQETGYYADGTTYEKEVEYEAAGLVTDGEYLYVTERYVRRYRYDKDGNTIDEWDEAYIHVYDLNLNKVVSINMAEELEPMLEGIENTENYVYYNQGMNYLEDMVYCLLPSVENYNEELMFRCKRSDFLAGSPEFELVLRKE